MDEIANYTTDSGTQMNMDDEISKSNSCYQALYKDSENPEKTVLEILERFIQKIKAKNLQVLAF